MQFLNDRTSPRRTSSDTQPFVPSVLCFQQAFFCLVFKARAIFPPAMNHFALLQTTIAAMKPFSSELIIGLLSIGLNYGATFKLPSTSLLKDPVQTLSTAVPILFLGHVVLIVLANVLKGTTHKALVSEHGERER